MKAIVYSFFAFIGLLGCVGKAAAQSEQNRAVSGFHRVADAGSFMVHVKLGGTESLVLKGDADYLGDIETRVTSGGTLEIRWKEGTEPHHYSGRIDVYVTAKALDGLTCSGSGTLEVDGVVSGGDVSVTLSGSGDIVSAIDASKLGVTLSGSGNIRLKGKAAQANISISGSGKLSADALSADNADVSIAGSGDIYIKANKTISASIVGSGSVYYSGTATISSVRTVGSGRISRA